MEPNVSPLPRREYAIRDPREKSVPLAVLLSSLPGLGQIYAGAVREGFTYVLVVGGVISALNLDMGALHPLLGLFLAFFWLYNMIDAGQRAQAFNLSLNGTALEIRPATDTQGMLVGGLALVLLGLLALAQVTFGLSLAWIGRWWPLALILLGGLLVGQAWPRKARDETGPEGPETGA